LVRFCGNWTDDRAEFPGANKKHVERNPGLENEIRFKADAV